MTRKHVHVVQGDHVVTDDPDVVLTTILGSCVAACMRDPVAGVGGMNHFLLPGDPGLAASDSMRYGVHAMELLVNGLLSHGARRERLEAKLFGGARMVSGLSDIGAKNADFAERFLKQEGIRRLSSSLGGAQARRLQYWAVSGRARQMVVAGGEEAALAAAVRPTVIRPAPETGAVELF
jgi:chemotaxis protein CheD